MLRRAAIFAAGCTLAFGLATTSVAAGGGCHTNAGTTEGTGLAVSIKNCGFGPTILHTPLGATVTWTNDDYLPHAVNGLGWDAISPYTSANPGTTIAYKFDKAGIYPYMCYVHPGMSGVIVVGDVTFPGPAPVPSEPLTRPAIVSSAPLTASSAAITASNAPATSAATMPTVELPLAILLVIASGLIGYTFAALPRRWAALRGSLVTR